MQGKARTTRLVAMPTLRKMGMRMRLHGWGSMEVAQLVRFNAMVGRGTA